MIKYDLYNRSVLVKEDVHSGHIYTIMDQTHKDYYIKIRNGNDNDTQQSNFDAGWPRKEITHHIRIRVQTTGGPPSGFPPVMTVKNDGIDNWYTVESIGNEHDTLNDVEALTNFSQNIIHIVFEKALGLANISALYSNGNPNLLSVDFRETNIPLLNINSAFKSCQKLKGIGFDDVTKFSDFKNWIYGVSSILYVTSLDTRSGLNITYDIINPSMTRPNAAERNLLLGTNGSDYTCGSRSTWNDLTIFPTPPPTTN